MKQIDMVRIYRFLAEYRELDPETARGILRRILEVLRKRRNQCGENRRTKKEESAGNAE